jgi:hypothetical protein
MSKLNKLLILICTVFVNYTSKKAANQVGKTPLLKSVCIIKPKRACWPCCRPSLSIMMMEVITQQGCQESGMTVEPLGCGQYNEELEF